MKEQVCTVDRFDGGLTREPRGAGNQHRISKHFNLQAYPKKLKPYESLTADASTESDLDTYKITAFETGSDGYLYGLGVESGTSRPKIFYKTTTTGTWSAAPGTGFDAASGTRGEVLFIRYGAYLFGGHTGGTFKYGPIGGAPVFVKSDNGTAANNGTLLAVQGVVHSKDGYLYVVANIANQIWRNTSPTQTGSTAWGSAAVLTLPGDNTIVSMCEWGDYLAIGCNRTSGGPVIYLWDRNDSLNTLSESIGWGVGSLKFIENLNGLLVGVSVVGQFSTTLATIQPRLVVKAWGGGANVETVAWYFMGGGYRINPNLKFKYEDSVYFFLNPPNIDGTNMAGMWSITKLAQGGISVQHNLLIRNDASLGGDYTTNLFKGLYRWDDYFFFSYLNTANSDKYTVWRTVNGSFGATSIYETTMNPGMDEGVKHDPKQLMSVRLMTESIVSGQSATVSYRVDSNSTDGAGTWTEIGTISDVGATAAEFTVEAAGDNFDSGREYEFQLKSTGGAQITALQYRVRTTSSLL